MGAGESGPMDLGGVKRSRSPSAASPAAFCLLCRRGQSRSPPVGGETPLELREIQLPQRLQGPLGQLRILVPLTLHPIAQRRN